MKMAFYKAKVETAIGDVAVAVDLRTAKTLAQVAVDNYRTRELHLKQVPLEWERGHSDNVVYWNGFIGNELVIQFESL
jgi:hypothetical protein